MHVKYNATIEGSSCKLSLDYDPEFVRSPRSEIVFSLTESYEDKLVFIDYDNRIGHIFEIVVYA